MRRDKIKKKYLRLLCLENLNVLLTKSSNEISSIFAACYIVFLSILNYFNNIPSLKYIHSTKNRHTKYGFINNAGNKANSVTMATRVLTNAVH